MNYSGWFHSPVEDSRGFWDGKDGYVRHGDYLMRFYAELLTIIKSKGYTIRDEKAFKQEIALFVYSLSDESSNDYIRQ